MNNGTINDDLSLGRNPFGFDLNESFDYDYFGGATTRGVNRRGGRTRARIFVFGDMAVALQTLNENKDSTTTKKKGVGLGLQIKGKQAKRANE